jgi:hypothetical protein
MSQDFPVYFQWLPIAVGASTRHTCDMADDSKLIMQMALNHARDRLAADPKLAKEVRDDLIARYVETRRADTGEKLKDVIVPEAALYYGVSERTVWNALGAKKRKKLHP